MPGFRISYLLIINLARSSAVLNSIAFNRCSLVGSNFASYSWLCLMTSPDVHTGQENLPSLSLLSSRHFQQ
jgi:hypothetical protein